MKFKFNSILALLLLSGFAFTFSGCKTEGCTDPLATNYDEDADKNDGSCVYPDPELKMHLHPMFGSDAFTYGTEYELASGRKIQIDIARFYISNIRLQSASGDVALTGVYKQFVPTMMHYALGEVAPGSYTGISFDIGIGADANLSDPAAWSDDHALSVSSPTHDHWSWNSGYVFVKVEGKVDGSAAMNEAVDDDFVYHVGTANLKRSVSIPTNFTLTEGGEGTVHLSVDVEQFFNSIDLTSQFDTHTMNDMPLANLVADNVAASIEAE